MPSSVSRPSRPSVDAARRTLRHFIGRDQLAVMVDGLNGEEGDWFAEKFVELATLVDIMPPKYGHKGDDPLFAYLRYFAGARATWYIAELSDEPDDKEQNQAFGHAEIFAGCGELGRISIAEIIGNGGELDLHFKPKELDECTRGN